MPSDVDFSHQPLHSFLTADQPNPLDITKLYASNADTNLFSLETPTILLLKKYNKSHVVQFLCTTPFTQQYFPPRKSQNYPPFQMQNRPPKNNFLSTPPYLLCRPSTSGHEPYPCPHCTPLQIPSSYPTYHYKSWNPPLPRGLGLYLPSPVSMKHALKCFKAPYIGISLLLNNVIVTHGKSIDKTSTIHSIT